MKRGLERRASLSPRALLYKSTTLTVGPMKHCGRYFLLTCRGILESCSGLTVNVSLAAAVRRDQFTGTVSHQSVLTGVLQYPPGYRSGRIIPANSCRQTHTSLDWNQIVVLERFIFGIIKSHN